MSKKEPTIVSSYGEESYDYPEDDSGNLSCGASELMFEDEEEPIPAEGEMVTTEMILCKMKDQIDEVEGVVKERTIELRDLKKYVKRLETQLVTALEDQFKSAYLKIDYNEKDMKDLLHQRLNIISSKLM